MTVTYIYGPPCSGKMEYVADHARSQDLVIERTSLAAALHPYSGDEPYLSKAVHRSWTFLVMRVATEIRDASVWIVETGPEYHKRKAWQELADQIILMDPGRDECHRRAREQGMPPKAQWIDRWYERYSPDLTEEQEAEQRDRREMINKRLVVDRPQRTEPSRQW